jgi:hypothetical protein
VELRSDDSETGVETLLIRVQGAEESKVLGFIVPSAEGMLVHYTYTHSLGQGETIYLRLRSHQLTLGHDWQTSSLHGAKFTSEVTYQ